MSPRCPAFVALVFCASLAPAQTEPRHLRPLLEHRLQSPDVVAAELRAFLLKKATALRPPASAGQWSAESQRLRERILRSVVFRGWPREWVEAPLKVEDLGRVPSGEGYRMRKLRYEIVPGFWSTAILYEPAEMKGKMPAVLNVNGHVGAPGKSVEYKQKRCINQAKRGMIALNLEWIGMGELSGKENSHWTGAHLNLTGTAEIGLFYLAMRKGLDFLWDHPNVDRSRIAMTGLSGGGWQTIVLSSLDERVAVSIPVAGYSAFVSRVERADDTGDLEQNPNDFILVADYPHLTALRAPRPTLLIYNAEDDCCFRAPLVKPYIFDHVRPFFALYGAAERLAWHENTDPSDHNYQLDNRVQAYRFLTQHLGLNVAEQEIPVDGEIKSYEELLAGLPPDNLTVLGLARKIAAGISLPPVPPAGEERRRWVGSQRVRLRETVHYKPVSVRHAWPVHNTKNKGLETVAWRFEFENGLSAAGVLFKAIAAPQSAPVTLVLDDRGKQNAAAEVSERVNRGERVLALDLLFTGDAAPQKPGPDHYAQMIAAAGERPLGIEAAQLAAIARWLGAARPRIESRGMRSQVVALVAAALEPQLFGERVHRDGIASLRLLLDKPVEYNEAPDLFCFGLLKEFDIDRLEAIAGR